MYREIRILVADDDENDAFFLKRAFLKAGINAPLEIVQGGTEAIDYLAGRGAYGDRLKYPLPKLILLDVKMPRVDGFGVLKWLREQPGLELIPTIMLSSSGEQKDVDHAHSLGANGYTVKPTVIGDFGEVVEGIEKYWLKQHRYPSLRPVAEARS